MKVNDNLITYYGTETSKEEIMKKAEKFELVDRIFKVNEDDAEAVRRIKELANELAVLIVDECPTGRWTDLAIENLTESMVWAIGSCCGGSDAAVFDDELADMLAVDLED